MIQKLLSAVHKYYPIGCPEIHQHYEGIAEIKKIVSRKISECENNPASNFKILLKSLQNTIKNYVINDFSYLLFPSYFILIEIEDKTFNGIKLTSTISVYISLLINGYTVYISDKYSFNDLDDVKNKSGLNYELIYFNDCKNPQSIALTKLICDQIEKNFANYEFIDHYTLFKNYVKSGRTLYDLNRDAGDVPYCYYDYLFSIDKVLDTHYEILF